MKLFIGQTDFDWYSELREQNFDEVNFWRPGMSPFRALQPNDLFLFKLKKPYYAIVGGGFFVSYSMVPLDLAWQAFGRKNGTKTQDEFISRITKYREKNHIESTLLTVGCIILTQPFFFHEDSWIKQPADWPMNAVGGAGYDTNNNAEARRIYQQVSERLSQVHFDIASNPNTEARYSECIAKRRLGQGAFRIVVTDMYQRRCAISGEKTLPVLEAAHVKPFSMNGENTPENGVLLRSDIHTLFDTGYITITDKHIVEVSHRLNQDFGNGKDYYRFHGQTLAIETNRTLLQPSKENLNWHNEHIYLG